MWDDAVAASYVSHKPVLVFDLDLVDTNSLTVAHRVIESKSLQKFILQRFEPALNDFAVDPPMSVGLDSLRNLGLRLSGFERNFNVPLRPTIFVLGVDTSEMERIVNPQTLSVKALEARLTEILQNKNTLRAAIAEFWRDTTNVALRQHLIDLFEEHSRYDSVVKHLEVLVRSSDPAIAHDAKTRYTFLRLQVEGNPEPLQVYLPTLNTHRAEDSELYLHGLESLAEYYQARKKVDSVGGYFDRIMAFTGSRPAGMLNDYAWMLANQSKEWDKALSLVDEALQQQTDPNFLDTKALVLHQLGRDEDALKTAKRALLASDKKDKKYFEERVDFYRKALLTPKPPKSDVGSSDSK